MNKLDGEKNYEKKWHFILAAQSLQPRTLKAAYAKVPTNLNWLGLPLFYSHKYHIKNGALVFGLKKIEAKPKL